MIYCTFNQINALGITPAECVEWARTVITHKNGYILPEKVSIKYGDNRFFNTMPSYIPEKSLFGVKVVSRIPGRRPALLALIVLLLAETAGLWLVNHKLVIPPARMIAWWRRGSAGRSAHEQVRSWEDIA